MQLMEIKIMSMQRIDFNVRMESLCRLYLTSFANNGSFLCTNLRKERTPFKEKLISMLCPNIMMLNELGYNT